MAWIINKYGYCIEENLIQKNIPHAISTKILGNMKLQNNRDAFFSILKQDNIFKNITDKNLFFGKQVHSSSCERINNINFASREQEFDGLYTSDNDVALGVFTADCVPVFIVGDNSVAMVHAGWRGVCGGIVKNAIVLLQDNFAVKDFFVVIGPHIKSCCYEVGKEMKQYFFINEKSICGENKYYLDLEREVIFQLEKMGVGARNIIKSNLCTCCRDDLFYSYRKEKTENRMISLIGKKG